MKFENLGFSKNHVQTRFRRSKSCRPDSQTWELQADEAQVIEIFGTPGGT